MEDGSDGGVAEAVTRKRPSTPNLGKRLECLFRRFPILCNICGERIDWDADKAWDHVLEFADCHDDSAENYAPVHSDPCHRIKSGKSEATRHHVDRLERQRNGQPKRKRDLHKKEIKSRGFDKSKTRKFSGEVVSRG